MNDMQIGPAASATLRRLDWLAFVIGGMFLLAIPVVLAVNWPVPWKPWMITSWVFIGVAVCSYLDGPSVSMTVEPGRVIVRNIFISYQVPRHLIIGLYELENLALSLDLGERKVPLRVWEPALIPATSRSGRRSLARTRAVEELFRNVPIAAGAGVLERRLRLSNVLLTIAPVVGILAVWLSD